MFFAGMNVENTIYKSSDFSNKSTVSYIRCCYEDVFQIAHAATPAILLFFFKR